MNAKPPYPVAASQRTPEPVHKKTMASPTATDQGDLADDDPPPAQNSYVEKLLHYLLQLGDTDQLFILQQLFHQLNTKFLTTALETGQQELISRRTQKSTTASVPRETALTLKKDYTYQDRGLSEPTQYYVYLRRRKPKLDRYIGTLFYVPTGCVLNYISDSDGNLIFQAPHNVFQLTDAKNPTLTKVVRLIRLEPPPPDYTFTKQQQDTPAIALRVEFLQPLTLEAIAEQCLPFPSCMHEGGVLDRYRWDVTVITAQPESAFSLPPVERLTDLMLTRSTGQAPPVSEAAATSPKSAVLNLPLTQSATYYLTDATAVAALLERLQLWVSWSEKAMPQSRWAIAQKQAVYTLMNATFKRSILSVSTTDASVTLHGSLAVMVKWFHDLSLAVSQSQSQKRYSFNQLKLAHNLFVDMSLPQTEPLPLLKKLFGVEFTQTR
jgi:hypothetical protein